MQPTLNRIRPTSNRHSRRALTTKLVLGGVALVALLLIAADWWIALPLEAEAHYVGRNRCAECHHQQVERWTGSHHDLAMQVATSESVLGDFEQQSFHHAGVTSTMARDGEKFFVTTDGPDGELTKYEVAYAFGVEPLQQYLIEMEPSPQGIGRVQCLPLAWDTRAKRWFHLYPDEQLTPSDPLHWTQPAQNWNYMCAECHSTNLQKNFDLATRSYHTTFSEINVSCEACHGPGSMHVELAEARSLFWDRHHGYGLARLKDKSNQTEIVTCARCHARRRVIREGFEPGQAWLDYYAPELLDSDVYHVDGQIRDEAYEYGSFLQSRMYRENVRCTDCHDPHTNRLKAQGNNLCLQCHVAGKYDTPAHHHHTVGTPGASCVDCHMPQTAYMVVDPRRDHSIRVPRPDLTVDLGTPNACNGCHTVETEDASWAARKIVDWYGPKRSGDPHFAHAIAAGRAGSDEAPAKLARLAARRDVGPIVRASAVALLGRFATNESQGAIERHLTDDEPLVRAAAAGAAHVLSPQRRLELLSDRLRDTIRLVRIEAVRQLALVGAEHLAAADRPAFDAALADFEAAQQANNDQPGAHLNLGAMYADLGRPLDALRAYRTALLLDASFLPALANLALLYHEQGDKTASEETYRQLIARAPEMAEAHYSLGLLLAENPDRMEESVAALSQAAKLDPTNPRMHYNLGLALQRLGRLGQAAESLAKAERLAPREAEYLYALAVLHAQAGQWQTARHYAEKLRAIQPRQGQAMLERIAIEERAPRSVGPAPR